MDGVFETVASESVLIFLLHRRSPHVLGFEFVFDVPMCYTRAYRTPQPSSSSSPSTGVDLGKGRRPFAPEAGVCYSVCGILPCPLSRISDQCCRNVSSVLFLLLLRHRVASLCCMVSRRLQSIMLKLAPATVGRKETCSYERVWSMICGCNYVEARFAESIVSGGETCVPLRSPSIPLSRSRIPASNSRFFFHHVSKGGPLSDNTAVLFDFATYILQTRSCSLHMSWKMM